MLIPWRCDRDWLELTLPRKIIDKRALVDAIMDTGMRFWDGYDQLRQDMKHMCGYISGVLFDAACVDGSVVKVLPYYWFNFRTPNTTTS